MKILGVCGSLQASSVNLHLLQRAQALAPAGVTVTLYDGLRDLPQFDPDLERDDKHPEVEALRRAVAASDALLIACPEYGFSLPGSLKNAIDWLIGSGELERKLIATTAATVHPGRGLRGLGALHDTLSAVSSRVVGGQPIVRGETLDQAVLALLDAIVRELSASEPASD